MSTATRVATIIDLAGQADLLIEQLRPILVAIEAEENSLYSDAATSGESVTDAIVGRRRLAQYAQGRCFNPQWGDTVAQFANKAWGGIL